jgi:hypothetical protein
VGRIQKNLTVGNDLTVNDNLIVNDNFNMTGVFNAISTGLGSVGEFWELIQILSISSRSRCLYFYINRCREWCWGQAQHKTQIHQGLK